MDTWCTACQVATDKFRENLFIHVLTLFYFLSFFISEVIFNISIQSQNFTQENKIFLAPLKFCTKYIDIFEVEKSMSAQLLPKVVQLKNIFQQMLTNKFVKPPLAR